MDFHGGELCREFLLLTSDISWLVFKPAPYKVPAIVIDVTAAVRTNRRTFAGVGILRNAWLLLKRAEIKKSPGTHRLLGQGSIDPPLKTRPPRV